jgi:hypothetical protein
MQDRCDQAGDMSIAPDQRKWVDVLEGESVAYAGRVVGAAVNDKAPLRAVFRE